MLASTVVPASHSRGAAATSHSRTSTSTPLETALVRAASTASGSLSKARTGRKPRRAAAMLRMPDPVPASVSGPSGASSCSSASTPLVVG